MTETPTRPWRRWREAAPALPALATLLAVLVLLVGAAARGLVFEPSVAGVFVVVGAVATLASRHEPWRGALFIVGLATLVAVVLYVL